MNVTAFVRQTGTAKKKATIYIRRHQDRHQGGYGAIHQPSLLGCGQARLQEPRDYGS